MAKPISAYVRAKQIAKGIYDSPCLSECSFKKENDRRGDTVCKVCGLTQDERRCWKSADAAQKSRMTDLALQRRAVLGIVLSPAAE